MTEMEDLLSTIGKLTVVDHVELIEKLYALDHMKAYKDIQSKYILEFVATYGPVSVRFYQLVTDHRKTVMVSLSAKFQHASLLINIDMDMYELKMYPLILNVPSTIGTNTYRTILYHDILLSTPGICFTISKSIMK